MSNVKKTFILHVDSLSILELLTDEQAGQLFKAIRTYHLGEKPVMEFWLQLVFTSFENQFIRDSDKYSKIVVRNQNNGKLGGRPKKTQQNPNEPKKPDSDSDNDSDSVNDNVLFDIPAFDNAELLIFFNTCFGKRCKVFPQNTIKKYIKLLKQGYKIADIKMAMVNAKNDGWHKEQDYKYCTLDFFTRVDKLDRFLGMEKTATASPKKYIPTI